MPLNPQTEAMLKGMAAAMPAIDFASITAPAMRAAMSIPNPLMAAAAEPVARIENRTVPRHKGETPIRIYVPEGKGPMPITVYFHGGGWVIGTLDMYNPTCTKLANRTGSIVVSVDYRLAPEAKFPEPVDDCLGALRWVHDNAASFGGDRTRIAVAGDSAGGNLSAVVAQLSRNGGPALCHQLLIYPVTDLSATTPSYRENGPLNLLLSDAMMKWFADQYLPSQSCAFDHRASPLLEKNLKHLPGATVITAEFDPLRDEGEAYARALTDAGIPTALRRWNGQVHGFMGMLGIIDDALEALEFGAEGLRKAFAAR
ncbi:MAG: alpha/beta hydrolase [Proteobacteria bacterium]|nr:alpha/beta hydrolase [Pseudomonadota bacterium]HQR04075.1 alpha/beta hydrolase [Rhodocyclaceae bacterium]